MAFVIGTAGHVDHGKSVLIRALTGIDPDRLREEKERGMTIDLGFAWLTLPSGRDVSIVDVPGHERFIKNMLAGVGGIDLALLIIAADEGVMPQTREHLAILNLLKVQNGIAVITKKDLVDDDWLELVMLDMEEVLSHTVLAKAPVIVVSAVTGEGLEALTSTIDSLFDSIVPRRDIGKPRLPVDRVFTMAGFGTVITGTLIDGRLSVGQEVEILPQRLKTHIRGLQTHKQKLDTALPGSRVAVNLSGVSTSELKRGDVITSLGWLTPTRAVDARLEMLASAPHGLSHNTTVTFHTSAAETQARIRLLDADQIQPGQTAFAQFVMEQPIAIVKNDMFIIRSSSDTLGGGQVIDSMAKRHRRFHPGTIESLEARETGTAEDMVLAMLDPRRPSDMDSFLAACNMSQAEATQAIGAIASRNEIVLLGDKKQLIFSSPAWGALAREVQNAIQDYHRRNPLREGMPKEELKGRLKLPEKFAESAINRLVTDGTIVESGLVVHLPDHEVKLKPDQQAKIDAFLKALQKQPYAPPSDLRLEPDLMNMLIGQHQVVKVSNDVVFEASAYNKMVETVVAHIRSEGKITVAEVRDMFSTSRKYALALMEYLDEQKITRRVGDERVLR